MNEISLERHVILSRAGAGFGDIMIIQKFPITELQTMLICKHNLYNEKYIYLFMSFHKSRHKII